MNSKERVVAALELREPDRVPVMDLLNDYAVVYTVLGKKPNPVSRLFASKTGAAFLDRFLPLFNRTPLSPWATYSEMAKFAHDAVEASCRLGEDAVWFTFFPIFRIRSSKVVHDIFGRCMEVSFDRMGNMATPLYRNGLIASPADWEAWDKRPLLRLPELVRRALTPIAKDFGDDIFLFPCVDFGLFENTWQPLGFERYTLATRKERSWLEEMIGWHAELYCDVLEAVAGAGVPGIIYGDDLAFRSGPMLNPRLLEELYGDGMRRIVNKAHALGLKIVMHSCGNVTSLLDWLAGCGFDAIHPLEPTAGVELAEAKRQVGEKLCLIGNLDITYLLVEGSRDEVFAAVRDAIRDAGRCGGFIVAPDHSHADISVERLSWMVEAVKEYGSYEPQGSR
ncbi:MAG: uroporphyrinogen decarboxylase family protein [Candidatus Geothermincolia bacterium]